MELWRIAHDYDVQNVTVWNVKLIWFAAKYFYSQASAVLKSKWNTDDSARNRMRSPAYRSNVHRNALKHTSKNSWDKWIGNVTCGKPQNHKKSKWKEKR